MFVSARTLLEPSVGYALIVEIDIPSSDECLPKSPGLNNTVFVVKLCPLALGDPVLDGKVLSKTEISFKVKIHCLWAKIPDLKSSWTFEIV